MLEETKTPRNAVLGVFYAYFRGGLCFHLIISSLLEVRQQIYYILSLYI